MSWCVKLRDVSDDVNGVYIGICSGQFRRWSDACPAVEKHTWWFRLSKKSYSRWNEEEGMDRGLDDGVIWEEPFATLIRDRLEGDRATVELIYDASAGTLGGTIEGYQMGTITGIPRNQSMYPAIGGQGTFLSVTNEQIAQDAFPKLSAHIGNLLSNAQDADVVFEVGDERILAHGCMLRRIPYFDRMLDGSFRESRKRKLAEIEHRESCVHSITLHDVDPTSLRRILQFIYTDDAKAAAAALDYGNVMNLARAAHKYELVRLFSATLEGLEKLCSDDSLPPAFVLDVLSFAQLHDCNKLREIMMGHIQKKF